MDNFFKLRAEKQEHIINAALTVFGSNGYKKTSVADIAGEAGISKSMVLYYFGSKKNLYAYLVGLCSKTFITAMDAHFDETVTDFFDRLRVLTDVKISVMKRHPAMVAFFSNLFYETDPEVADILGEFMNSSAVARGKMLFAGMDVSKFKDDVDANLLGKFITWAGVGCVNDLPKNAGPGELDGFMAEFYRCFDWMKKYFYKGDAS